MVGAGKLTAVRPTVRDGECCGYERAFACGPRVFSVVRKSFVFGGFPVFCGVLLVALSRAIAEGKF